MVGFLTLKAGCSPHGALRETNPERPKQALCENLWLWQNSASLRNRWREGRCTESDRPFDLTVLIPLPPFNMQQDYTHENLSLVWTLFDSEKRRELIPLLDFRQGTPVAKAPPWPRHYANAAGCWHSEIDLTRLDCCFLPLLLVLAPL